MGKQEGKKLTKKAELRRDATAKCSLPSPSKGRDVPNGIRRYCGLGRWKEEEIGLKGVCLFLMVKCFGGQEYALPHRPPIL